MNTIIVGKDNLLHTLRHNLGTHTANYQQAYKDYLTVIEHELTQLLMKVKAGEENLAIYVATRAPTHSINEYNRIISMLEWHEGDTIELDHQQFKEWVQDDWSWKGQTDIYYSGLAETRATINSR